MWQFTLSSKFFVISVNDVVPCPEKQSTAYYTLIEKISLILIFRVNYPDNFTLLKHKVYPPPASPICISLSIAVIIMTPLKVLFLE